nr:uncharacterized protein LOC129269741 [Lytechinus pictus]
MSTAENQSSPDNQTANGKASRLFGDQSPTMPGSAEDVLPLPVRLALVFIGHWRPGVKKDEEKTLTPSKENNNDNRKESKYDEEKMIGGPRSSTDDVTSLLLRHDENLHIQEERTPLCKRLKEYCRCSDLMGMAFLIFSCCMMFYDLEAYFHSYWGVKEYTLHFVTYVTFVGQLMVLPYWFLFTRIKYGIISKSHLRVSTTSRNFIAHRIKVIRRGRSDSITLSWFPFCCILAWPVITGCFRVLYDYEFRLCKISSIHGEVSHWNSLLGFVTYGCFCYILYLQRKSFEIEAHQVFRYALEQAPYQNVDAVLSRIRQFNLQYKFIRKHVRRWMAFTILVSTFGLTSCIAWNYLVFNEKKKNNDPDLLWSIYFMNALVSSQKITFVVVPVFALGGFNLDHIWRRFKENIAHSREYKYKKFWKAVTKYVKDINHVSFSGDVTSSIISSGIGLYLGLNLTKSQDISFWVDPAQGCNLTFPTGF